MTQQSLGTIENEISAIFDRNNMCTSIRDGPFWWSLQSLSTWNLGDVVSLIELIRKRELLAQSD